MENIATLQDFVKTLGNIDIDAIKESVYKQYNITGEDREKVESEISKEMNEAKAKKKEAINEAREVISKMV